MGTEEKLPPVCDALQSLWLPTSATITLQKSSTSESLSEGRDCYLQQRLQQTSFKEFIGGNFEVILKFIFHPKQRREKGFSGTGQRSDARHCRKASLPTIRCLTAPSKADGLFLGVFPVLLVKAAGDFTS